MLRVKGSYRGQMQDGDHTDGHYITLFAEQLTRTFEVLVFFEFETSVQHFGDSSKMQIGVMGWVEYASRYVVVCASTNVVAHLILESAHVPWVLGLGTR